MKFTIRELRARKNMSMQDLSDASGVSRIHINRIELGTSIPTITIALKLAKALDVKVDDIKWN